MPRGSRRRANRALATALTVIGGLAATIGVGYLVLAKPGPQPSAQAPSCADLPDSSGCRSLEIDGIGTVRYRISNSAASDDTADVSAVLFDAGGPGRTLFGMGTTTDLPSWTGETPPVFVELEEPWVTRPVTATCRAALTSFLRYVRADGEYPEQLVADCDLEAAGRWGWEPDAHRQAVDAIGRAEHLKLDGAIGLSFGARRVAALSNEIPMSFVIAVSPPPRSESGNAFVDERLVLARSLFDSVCTCGTLSTDEVDELLSDVADELAASPVSATGRSLPVNGADAEAALLALPYLPPAEQTQLADALITQPSESTAEMIGRWSDAITLRYGTEDVSPAYLAYLDEVCRSYDFSSVDGRDDRVIERLHRPCSHLGSTVAEPDITADVVCVGSGSADYVVGGAQTAVGWSPPNGTLIELNDSGHADGAITDACIRELQLDS